MTSIVKIVLGAMTVVLLAGCPNQPLPPIPDEHLFTPDIANNVCVEYKLADSHLITFTRVATYKLVAGGPCDHMRGFTSRGFKNVQNWIREAVQDTN